MIDVYVQVPSERAKYTRQKPWIVRKEKETLYRRERSHKKWQKSQAEKDQANYLTPHSKAHATVCKAPKDKSILRAS